MVRKYTDEQRHILGIAALQEEIEEDEEEENEVFRLESTGFVCSTTLRVPTSQTFLLTGLLSRFTQLPLIWPISATSLRALVVRSSNPRTISSQKTTLRVIISIPRTTSYSQTLALTAVY